MIIIMNLEQHVNRMPHNRLLRIKKNYTPKAEGTRENH
jgi:hypothetical protein